MTRRHHVYPFLWQNRGGATVPSQPSILRETDGYILQETGYRINLEDVPVLLLEQGEPFLLEDNTNINLE